MNPRYCHWVQYYINKETLLRFTKPQKLCMITMKLLLFYVDEQKQKLSAWWLYRDVSWFQICLKSVRVLKI